MEVATQQQAGTTVMNAMFGVAVQMGGSEYFDWIRARECAYVSIQAQQMPTELRLPATKTGTRGTLKEVLSRAHTNYSTWVEAHFSQLLRGESFLEIRHSAFGCLRLGADVDALER